MRTIEFHRSVTKFIRTLNEKQQKRVLAAIYRLPQGDVLPIAGKKANIG